MHTISFTLRQNFRWATLALAPFAVTLALTMIAPGPSKAQDLNIVRIGTGSTAGTYFPIGGLIGNIISNPPGSRPCERGGSCGVPGLIAVAQSTGGSLDNIKAIDAGTMTMGLSQADVAYWSYYGTGAFVDEAPRGSIRAIANLYPENIHLIARADAGIDTVADLKGKRVSIGGPGSGSQINARLILQAFGVRFEDMKFLNLNLEPSTGALVAGDIDAFFLVSGAPALAIQDLAERVPLSFIPIDGPIAEQLARIFPFYSMGTIPEGIYGDNPPTKTLDVGAVLLVKDDMPNELAYGITRAIWHPNTVPLLANSHPRARLMDISRAIKGIGFQIHPGARQYYIERGTLVGQAADAAEDADSLRSIR
ncbi:MAG: TAXI family TRAP transporter solute-binding subunit [Rhodospirillaceae bacterium]